MSKLRIRVDQDKCQGHARCKSLAPELFELDEYGNAHEVRRRLRARWARGQGLARADQLPGNRDRGHRGIAPAERTATAPPAAPTRFDRTRRKRADVRFLVRELSARTSPGHRLGPAISTIPIRSGPTIRSRSGRTLRAASPVVHTERFLGCYMPTTYQAVKEIAYDTEHFSSRRVIVRDVRPGDHRRARRRSPPIRRSTSPPSRCCCRRSRRTR